MKFFTRFLNVSSPLQFKTAETGIFFSFTVNAQVMLLKPHCISLTVLAVNGTASQPNPPSNVLSFVMYLFR